MTTSKPKPKISVAMMRLQLVLGMIMSGATRELLVLDLKMLSRHMFLAGNTGGGKTMLLLWIMRQLVSQGVGFTFVTPHSDARKLLLEWCAVNGVDPSRIVDVSPSPECAVGIDPFAHPPEDATPLEYEAWLWATVDGIVAAMLRNVPKSEQQLMKRLKRWLENVLYAAGKDIDGEHLGIPKALVLLNPAHPLYEHMMQRLWPHLPDHVREDFRTLQDTKNARQREQWTESTINTLRDLLKGPVVPQMLAANPDSLNDQQIVAGSKIQIVSVPETDFCSRAQGDAIAGLRINAMMSAARRLGDKVPEEDRIWHPLIIDEAENFIGEDLRTGFQELRKFKMPIVICFQGVSCLLRGKMDLMSKVANECGIQATMQQQDVETLEYLGKAFALPFLDFEELTTKQVLPAGHKKVLLHSESRSSSTGRSLSHSRSKTETNSTTQQRHSGFSINRSVSEALSESHTDGNSISAGAGGSQGRSLGNTWTRGVGRADQASVTRGESQSRQLSLGQSTGESRERSFSQGLTTSTNEGVSASLGQTEQRSIGHSEGNSENWGVNKSISASESQSESSGLSLSKSQGTSTGSSESHQSSTSQSSGTTETQSMSNTVSASSNDGTSSLVGGDHMTTSHGDSHGSSATTGSSLGHTNSTSNSSTNGTSNSFGQSTSQGETVSSGQSRGQSTGISQGESQGAGVSQSDSTGLSNGASLTSGETSNQGLSETTTTGRSAGTSNSQSRGLSWGQSESLGASVGQTLSTTASVGGSASQTEQESWSLTGSASIADSTGRTRTEANSDGRSWGESEGKSHGQSLGETFGDSSSLTEGETFGVSETLVQEFDISDVPTGRMRVAVPDQIAKAMQRIGSLSDRHLLMKVRGIPFSFVLRVPEVNDPYAQKGVQRCREWREHDFRRYVAQIRKAQPWYFLPTFKGVPAPVEGNTKYKNTVNGAKRAAKSSRMG